MPIAEVAGQRATAFTPSATDDSRTLAFPGSVVAGNLLAVLGVNWRSSNNGGSGLISVSDTLGTVYTVLNSPQIASEYRSFIAFGHAPSSGACTVTVDPEGVNNVMSFSIDEFSGVGKPPLEADGGSGTGTSTHAERNVTSLFNGALLFGVMGVVPFTDPVGMTPDPYYTQIGEHEDNNTATAHNAVYRVAGGPGVYQVGWSLGASYNWFAYAAAVQEVPVTVPTAPIYGSRVPVMA